MWTITEPTSGLTNKVTMPSDGIISIVKPEGAEIHAFINDKPEGIHHLHVKAGDVVHFEARNTLGMATKAALEFEGNTSYLNMAAGTAEYKKENKMGSEAVNLFSNPDSGMGSALGGGLGAGLLGGVLGGALLGNNGVLGNRGGYPGYGGYPPASITEVQQVVGNNAIMQALGDIKASVPEAEGQLQLALAGAQMNVTNAVTAGTGSVIGAVSAFESAVMSNLNMQTQMNQKGFADNTAATVASGNTNLLATERAAYAVTQAVNNDGDKTRALIQSIDKTNDSRMITDLANQVAELRGDRRLAEATGNITISNNNTATAVAQQQQSQQQFQILANLNAQLHALNNDIQSIRQSSVVFNSGSMRESGNQAAANTRVA